MKRFLDSGSLYTLYCNGIFLLFQFDSKHLLTQITEAVEPFGKIPKVQTTSDELIINITRKDKSSASKGNVPPLFKMNEGQSS